MSREDRGLHPLDCIAWDWGVRCFGVQHMSDTRIRALRMAEEAIELTQALELERELLHRLVDAVFSRPHGSVHQEAGGTLLTVRMLCVALNLDPEDVFLKEIRRCLSKSPEEFAKRNQEKIKLGLTT
jgi:NTP pyrophosphatase (non-canonical NTP hydrolase)